MIGLNRTFSPWRSGGGKPTDGPADVISIIRALSCPPVQVAVRTLSQVTGALDWDADADEARRALNKPNGYQDRSAFIGSLARDIVCYGRAGLRHERQGGTMAMATIDPATLTLHDSSTIFKPVWLVDGTHYGPESLTVITDGGSHDAGVVSRVDGARPIIEMLLSELATIKGVFDGGLNLHVGFKHKHALDTRLKELWDKAVADKFDPRRPGESAAGFAARRAGALNIPHTTDVVEFKGLTPADADLRSLLDMLLRILAALMGVPPSVVGVGGQDKYANAQIRATIFARESIDPLALTIAEGLGRAVGAKISYSIASILKGDWGQMVASAQQAAGGPVLTPNEARAPLGYGPVDGGGELRKEPMDMQGGDPAGDPDLLPPRDDEDDELDEAA